MQGQADSVLQMNAIFDRHLHTDLGKVRTDRGPGRVVWRDGSREQRPLDHARTEARLKGHGVRLSLRYGF